MHSHVFKSVLAISVCSLSLASHAYDQKSCMQEIYTTVSNDPLKLLHEKRQELLQENAKNYANDKTTNIVDSLINQITVIQLVNEARVVGEAMDSVLVSSTLRQAGVFKPSKNLELLLDTQFQAAFETVRFAQDTFTRNVGTLTTPPLREKALSVSQQLEKISRVIRSCEK